MAGRLQKSTKADKFRFLNIGLEKKYTSQIDDLDRKQMLALGQIFRETRKIEIELQQQRNARLTEPIPFHLRGEGRRLGGSTLTNIWRDSASPGADSHLGMRRSASAGDLLGMSSGNMRARSQKPIANPSSNFNTVSSKRKVRFEDDSEEQAKEEPTKQSSIATISPEKRTGDVNFSAERIFDSTRALAVYRRLQRKVQESLEHGNNSKNPEAAVESTMKLMKRRQQRKMRDEQAEAAKKGGKNLSSSSGPELRARGQVTESSTKTRGAQGWRTPRREQLDGARSTNKEAYRLPSFTFDDESVHVNRSVDSGSNKLEGRKLMERETKLYLGKIQQTAENKRVTRKVDDYFAKY